MSGQYSLCVEGMLLKRYLQLDDGQSFEMSCILKRWVVSLVQELAKQPLNALLRFAESFGLFSLEIIEAFTGMRVNEVERSFLGMGDK